MVEIDHIVKHVYVKGDVEVSSIKKKKNIQKLVVEGMQKQIAELTH
jgi:hypothetical protein